MKDFGELCTLAIAAMERSYSPYSHFTVGAALLASSGRVYLGCNIENAAYSECICAERTAFAKAISEGENDFVALAVVGGKNGKIEGVCTPCGACRQVISEFCPPDFPILLVKGEREYEQISLGELLPHSFNKGSLK